MIDAKEIAGMTDPAEATHMVMVSTEARACWA